MAHKILSLDPDSLSIPERHGYLLSAVAPRPIAFASTIDKAGNVNLSPFSFFNVFSSNPPIMIFSPARRGKDNTTKHTLTNVQEVPECVISIVNHPMVEQMSLTSGEYNKTTNEFVKAGFTEVKSDLVKPPLVGESPVNFECKVQEVISLGDQGAAGNLVICKVVRIHIQEQYLNDQNRLDTEKLDLVGRMGGIWYNRASGASLFEIPKPLAKPGIGFDSLPDSFKKSNILSANDLARLASITELPTDDDLLKITEQDFYKEIKKVEDTSSESIHMLAKKLLDQQKTKEALHLLWSFAFE